jgi:thiopurine S-methyltransferase
MFLRIGVDAGNIWQAEGSRSTFSSRQAIKNYDEGIFMDADFWHEKWRKQEIAFHERQANPLLVKHFDELSLSPGSRVFVPLCGKTLDISWLRERGHRVAGAELSRTAVEQLFEQLELTPRIVAGTVDRYSADNVDIFVGDIFHLTSAMLGPIDAVYDRAALVAFPHGMRHRYTAHLKAITGVSPQLLITYEYDQQQMAGPPFSVPSDEVQQLYGNSHRVRHLERVGVVGGLKGCAAAEQVYLLTPV